MEIPVCKEILKCLGLAKGPVVIACPTCGRTEIDVAGLAGKVEDMVSGIDDEIRIAVMGCPVNGPGEARDADIGIAGGKGKGRIFVKGEPRETVDEDKMLSTLWKYVLEITGRK
jgi:(E)-4-hydroxy-3-methylbut-2-enyl-diphosphate synthase